MRVFAHRGESALHPENSQTSILACDASEMTGIEIDLYQTQDDFVVYHDRWLTRILNIRKTVPSLTQADLKQIKHRDGNPLPTLQWLIKTLSGKDLELNIELKNINSCEVFVNRLKAYSKTFHFPVDKLLVSSFRHDYLEKIGQLWPELKLGLLMATHPPVTMPFLPNFKIYSVHLDMDCISPGLIARCQQAGAKVFVYTVDMEVELLWLKHNKADGVFANDPRLAFKLLNN